MIYLFDDVGCVSEEVIEGLLPCLPAERRERVQRYRTLTGRRLCVVGYRLLCLGLLREHGISEYPRLSYNKNGKPYLTDFPNIHFNISHCGEMAACVVSQEEAGLDIQAVRPYNPTTAKRICKEDELELLNRSSDPDRLFCELWTIKEGFIKYSGVGLSRLKSIPSSQELLRRFSGRVFTLWVENYHICCFGGESDITPVTAANLPI